MYGTWVFMQMLIDFISLLFCWKQTDPVFHKVLLIS